MPLAVMNLRASSISSYTTRCKAYVARETICQYRVSKAHSVSSCPFPGMVKTTPIAQMAGWYLEPET